MRLRYALPALALSAIFMVTGLNYAGAQDQPGAPGKAAPAKGKPATKAPIAKPPGASLRDKLPSKRTPRPPSTPKTRAGGRSQAVEPAAPPEGAGGLPTFETGIDYKPTPPRSKISFNLEDATLQDLVRLMSSITGKRFIIPGKIRAIKATVYAPQKVSAAEAYRAFLSILELNGLALVPSGSYLKIVESSGIEARTIPLLIDQNVPREDRFVTHVMRVENVAADDISQVLGRFKSPEGSITAYAPTNTLIITDTGNNIRRMQRLIGAIDVPRGGEQLWIEPVHYANAGDLASRLTELFPPDAPSGKASPKAKKRPKPKGKKASAAAGGSTQTVGTRSGAFRVSSILADERTNSLLIIATEAAYLRVLELIRHLDIPLEEDGGIHVHALQHGDASEISQTLSQLISGGRRGGSSKSKGKASKSSAGSGNAGGTFEGEISITAHEPTNSLVITSSLHDYVSLKRVIEKLDSERRQVFIEAVVMDLNISRGRNLGLSFHGGAPNIPGADALSMLGFDAGKSAAGLANPDLLTGLAVGVQGPAIPGSQEQVGISVPAFGVALTALATSSNTNVLATPHLIALDNEEAEINIGQNVPLQGSSFGGIGGNLGAAAALGGATGAAGAAGGVGALGALGAGAGTVPRRDVGTRIRITPHINDSDEIRLEIDEEISELGTTVPGNAQAAVINRRTATTQVVVRDQQTVVIGGLMRDSVATSETKVPVLGDIPLIGALFRKREKNTAKTNLLLFLTPYIVRTQSDLRAVYERKIRERQEFLDRYFVFAGSEYNPVLDHSRTRGLVSEILLRLEEEAESRRLTAQALAEDPKEHTPRSPVGVMRRDGEGEGDYDPEAGDIVVENGEVSSSSGSEPAAQPASSEPASDEE